MRVFPGFCAVFLLALAPLAGVRQARAATSDAAIRLDAGLARPVLLAGQKNTAELRVSLSGRDVADPQQRPDANVCIAIDRSGSMAGEKIDSARRGALSALRRLRDSDTVAVVAYDDVVRVMVPATRVANRGAIEAGIAALAPGGGTALFAGVVKCAAEVRKFASPDRVNRIVLLSDGMANVGPSSPAELGALGSDLAAEGISVATVGLGLDYNEDLMVELAVRSDGSHVFVERATDLAGFLEQELGAVASVVARDVEVNVRCSAGARPLRVLGRQADIVGPNVRATLGKIYGRRQHIFIVELELDPAAAGSARPLADVEIAFRDLGAGRTATLRRSVSARFTSERREVEARVDPRIMSELSLLNSDANVERAVKLRDQGDFAAAQQVLQDNALDLRRAEAKYKDARVGARSQQAEQQAKSLSPKPADWNVQRKSFKKMSNDDLLQGL
jgi:Ca-activated chloride channel family protein